MSATRGAFAPVAIIGMGCRFPKAPDIDAYWRLMLHGVDAISEVPPSRWDVDAFYDPRPATPCRVVTRCGGFLDDIDRFDPYFFGISPREAIRIDPQQRLLLEVTWEAMERAGILRDRFFGSHTGVFVGVCTDDYITLERSDLKNIDIYMGTGGSRGSTAGRLAFVYGLSGPTAAIDTACSSSLVAVHQACNSLQAGDCDMALAGGVNVVLHPGTAVAFSQANMLSPDGRCKAFDARANGFVRSEGAGVVLLKPLAAALQDQDPIYAVIRATASNNDGSSSPFMTPSRTGQAALLRSAYERAGVKPQSVQYVEAHGTGTEVGDPIEAAAIADVIGAGRTSDQTCILGSSKTNIGHTEAAAGIAGLIKTTLCLHNRIIPPNLHFETPNPNIPWDELPFRVPTTAIPWPAAEGPARASVNSFGISGTNAHAVLEESPRPHAPACVTGNAANEDRAEILTLSAHTSEALDATIASYIDTLSATPAVDAPAPALRDICYSAAARRTHHEHRIAIVARSRATMLHKLESLASGEPVDGTIRATASAKANDRPVFVFSGIGTQWPGMGRRLCALEPVFRDSMLRCDAAIRAITGWSVIDEIDRPVAESRLSDIDRMQPAIFSVQVSLAALWKSWGITPSAIIGHSLGEIAAAYVAGALSLEDAALAACERSRLMHRTSGLGKMAAVGMSIEDAERAIEPYADHVSIAAVNSPSSCALTGEPAAIEDVARSLEQQGVFCRILSVSVACHSSQMDPLRPELSSALAHITPHAEAVPLYSTVLGRRVSGSELGPEYWARNLRQTVQFAAAANALLADDPRRRLFLELSPNPSLLTPLRQIAQHRNDSIAAVPSLRAREDERGTMLEAAGSLFVNGYPLDWSVMYAGAAFVPPPPYVWQRERFWFGENRDNMAWLLGNSSAHSHSVKQPMLDLHWEPADNPGTHCFETELDLKLMPALSDHRVEGMPLLPAAAYVEMALEASIEMHGPGPRILRDIQLNKAVFLSADKPTRIQLVMRPGSERGRSMVSSLNSAQTTSASFHFYSRSSDADDGQHDGTMWVPLASGHIEVVSDADQALAELEPLFSPENLDQQYEDQRTGDEFYASVVSGMNFGPGFRSVLHTWERKKGAVTLVQLPSSTIAEARSYSFHPALLDACFHSSNASRGQKERLSLPFAIESLEIRALPDHSEKFWCRISIAATDTGYRGELAMFDTTGRCVVRVNGYQTKFLDSKLSAAEAAKDWLYESRWHEVHAGTPATNCGSWLLIGHAEAAESVARSLAANGDGSGCTTLPASSTRDEVAHTLARIAATGPCRGIVYLGALDANAIAPSRAGSVPQDAVRLTRGLLDLLQVCAAIQWESPPRLFVVSRNAKDVGGGRAEQSPIALAQSPLAGLARVAAVELREFGITQIDIDGDTSPDQLACELLRADGENEIALRGDDRHALRLERLDTKDRATAVKLSVTNEGDQSYRLESSGTGVFDDLKLRAAKRRPPAAGEVEIRVAAVGLNFLDVLKGLNMAPGLPAGADYFGMECSGRIVAIGPDVHGLHVGDEVIAMDSTASGCFRAFLTTSAGAVFRKPPHLSFEEAATIPIAYQTAYYALVELGRLRKGESVLIHSAAGGVGMAALEIARQRGAVIFATAGTEEKRDYLRTLGVQYVMNSRTLDFAREVMEHTNGRGVDLVLNSLAGDAITESLGVLATGGRFLEIGKRDIYADSQIGLLPFQKNLSFFAIDLLRMRMEKPLVVEELTREIVDQISAGSFPALPFTRFPVSQVGDAFRYMAQGRHIGKIVVSLDEHELEAESLPSAMSVVADATYLITGGLGALGMAFARRLVDQGARHLALLGRHAPSAETEERIRDLHAAGAEVIVIAADVSDRQQLARAFAQIRDSAPPIRGIIHAAGITDDRTLLELTWDRFASVFASKIDGSWNLHQQSLVDDLDFFVLFSSAASVLGGAGQANYAAANSFLDALAHYRRGIGLPALSINWGPWAEIGMAAQDDNRGGRLAARGLNGIPVKEGTELLDMLLQQRPAQIAVMPIAWPVWAQHSPEAVSAPILRSLASEWSAQSARPGSEDGIRSRVLACESDAAALELLSSYLRAEVARILRIAEERLNPAVSLMRFGLDSLMAVELKSKIEVDFGVRFPAAKLLQGPSVADLSEWVASKMRTSDPSAGDATFSTAVASQPAPDPDMLSDDEVAALLRELLTNTEQA